MKPRWMTSTGRLVTVAVSRLVRCSSFIRKRLDVCPMRSLGNGGDDLVDGRSHPEVVDEMDVRPVDKLPIGTTVSTIPRKKVPHIRFSITDEKVKNGSTGILGKLLVKLAETTGCSDLLTRTRPQMVNVIVLEDGCVEVSEGAAPHNHARYVRHPKRDLMAELHRFALLGDGEKLREILGGSIFEIVENCINHRTLDELISSTNVIGQVRRGQAPNLIRRLPRRRLLRLVLLLFVIVR